MEVTIVTGSAGLIGSTAVLRFASQSDLVVGIDNDMRGEFFGASASVANNVRILEERLGDRYSHRSIDVRDKNAVDRVMQEFQGDIATIIHAAAQPSHDWAATSPSTDFSINTGGTFNLLEATRKHAEEATFVYLSTSKVYGDRPNRLPFRELSSRWDLPPDHPYYGGIDEEFGIDQCMHSLFGTSKLSGDLFVQEYGNYFGLMTGVFRAGCVTGARHAGVEEHGFLSHLIKTAVGGGIYTIFGYEGKQVRDNIHAKDLVRAIEAFVEKPVSGKVYNIGGGRKCNCSIREAFSQLEDILSSSIRKSYQEGHRKGDHRWYISDITKFRADFPEWKPEYTMDAIMEELVTSTIQKFESTGSNT